MTQCVALVTGANKGIGFAVVRALCKQLNNAGIVYLTARNEERGREAVARLNQEGLQPKFHQLDVTDGSSVSKLRDYLKEMHGGLDILVNNAGISFMTDTTQPFPVQASLTIATNFTALLDVSRELIPLVRSHGRIVNMVSRSAEWAYNKMSPAIQGCFRAVQSEQDVELLMKEFMECASSGDPSTGGWPENAYGISKMAVIALTRVQAADIAKDKTKEGVLLTCCTPGYVGTDMTEYKGPLTIDEGAITPVHLALLPPGSEELNGKMFSEKKLYDEFW